MDKEGTRRMQPQRKQILSTTVNGNAVEKLVDVRTTLADFLRDELGCISVHLGCEHGVCGACTVLVDSLPVRACIRLAVQVEGGELATLEGIMKTALGREIGQAFVSHFAMQCGFCTAGFAVSLYHLLQARETISDADIEEVLGGHICRCTGYLDILTAAKYLRDAIRTRA